MSEQTHPSFTVVAGAPDDVELAALTVVLSAVLAGGRPRHDDRPRVASWTRSQRPAAPGSWRARDCRW